MLRLRVIQAKFGDCLLLEVGSPGQPKRILIDGGPDGVYPDHLRPVLKNIFPRGGRIDLLVLSHVDNDHVIGLLDLLAELRQAREERAAGALSLSVNRLWHNTFAGTIDPQDEIQERLRELRAGAESAGFTMQGAGFTLEGILEGHQLQMAAVALGIPINPAFPGGLVLAGDAPREAFPAGLKMWVVGPTRKNLDRLRQKWLKWLEEHEARVAAVGPQAAVAADRSIPNLSSIMLLVEEAGRRLLLTGDGRGTDLLAGLKQAGLLDAQGRLHVNVLKLPHHGSARNVTRKFLQSVTADTYVICANGRDGNPDYSVLKMLVETARQANRRIEIVATNATRSTEKLLRDFDPQECGYSLTLVGPDEHEIVIEIS